MRNILLSLVITLGGGMGAIAQAHAFVLQDSIEFSYSYPSPYPYVLSPAIDILPRGFTTINVDGETYYYCNGVFYQKIMRDQKYIVVPPPVGALVFTIPQGYEYMLIEGIPYYEYEGVYYKRVPDGFKVTFPPV